MSDTNLAYWCVAIDPRESPRIGRVHRSHETASPWQAPKAEVTWQNGRRSTITTGRIKTPDSTAKSGVFGFFDDLTAAEEWLLARGPYRGEAGSELAE